MEEAANQMSPAVQQSKTAYDNVKERFGDAISEFDANPTMPFFEVLDPKRWVDIALYMRDNSLLQFNYMAGLSVVDYP